MPGMENLESDPLETWLEKDVPSKRSSRAQASTNFPSEVRRASSPVPGRLRKRSG